MSFSVRHKKFYLSRSSPLVLQKYVLVMRREYFVYILRCADSSYYTGITNNLQRRLAEHASGVHDGCYTRKRRPVELVYARSFRYVTSAIRHEKVVKNWSRKKKEALIRGDAEALRRYSKKKFPTPYKRQRASVRSFHVITARYVFRCALHKAVAPRTFAPLVYASYARVSDASYSD